MRSLAKFHLIGDVNSQASPVHTSLTSNTEPTEKRCAGKAHFHHQPSVNEEPETRPSARHRGTPSERCTEEWKITRLKNASGATRTMPSQAQLFCCARVSSDHASFCATVSVNSTIQASTLLKLMMRRKPYKRGNQ